GGPGGGPGGPGGGGPGGPGGFGGGGIFLMGGGGGRGRGRFDINRPHGALFYTLSDSAFDAAPYSLTGQPASKPSYTRHSFGAVLGGPLNIPKIYHGGDKTFFFLSYNGSVGDSPYNAFSTVPTLDERKGIFPVPIYDPATHLPFLNNTIPGGMISTAALNLLPFIPEPNLPGTIDNFHFVTSATNNTNNVNVRLIHNFGTLLNTLRPGGQRNLITFGFHYQTSDATLTNPFPSVGGDTSAQSFDIPIAYIRSFHKITNILRFDFNRNRVETTNLYAFVTDVAGLAGVTGVSTDPFDWGLPNLSFSNFAGVHDINPLLQRNQTLSLSDFMVWTHGKHTLRWGGDFRRLQINTHTDSNARGSFVFTGVNTAQYVGGLPVAGTGVDFADFLLGLPQMTSVQFGANNFYFRGNSWDLFVQDDWRVRGNLTLNFGLRYEYVSPYTELNNQIVNLDANPQFTAVAPVLPGQVGPFSGVFPLSLVRPDRNNFAPRIGIAWKPFAKTVVRAGYGINYNTGQYTNLVQQLAFQPPFSFTQTNVESATLPLTLENGFPPVPPSTITNNYGVDVDYALGYVQIWNLDVQREITPTLMLNLDYTGTKGTHLDMLEAPNRSFTGVRIPGVQPFLWETSVGDSIANAGTVRLRKRLQHGVSIGGSYTWSKSIDNASSIGGGQAVVAQNAFDLAAERGPSSFDQTQRFTADYLWELPFGRDRRWLAQPGALRTLLGDWSWSGDWTIASGMPFTARVLGNFADVNRGTNGTLRADYNGQPISLPDPSIAEWFNTAAFSVPPDGLLGTAGRNTIRGPGQVLFDMALSKVFSVSETRLLEFRAQATNIFNTPQFTSIDTAVNSPTFGRVVAVGPMRTMQVVARFRF
ncbi:MAG TPA: TonB-dependent receptor, partial [Terriglobales bacterium]|nr:TonB-dependent receptor [Terriglobales bacterium]